MKRWRSKSKLGWEGLSAEKEGSSLHQPWLSGGGGSQQCFIIEFQCRLPIITYIRHIQMCTPPRPSSTCWRSYTMLEAGSRRSLFLYLQHTPSVGQNLRDLLLASASQ